MTRHELEDLMISYGYDSLKWVRSGKLCGVMRMAYTYGLFVGLTTTGLERRYCYESKFEAQHALREWDGDGDPGGPWIKEKPSDRLGPGATA